LAGITAGTATFGVNASTKTIELIADFVGTAAIAAGSAATIGSALTSGTIDRFTGFAKTSGLVAGFVHTTAIATGSFATIGSAFTSGAIDRLTTAFFAHTSGLVADIGTSAGAAI
jgi:hypothetical protein